MITSSVTIADATEFIRGITFKPDELVSLEADDAVVCMRTKNIQKDLDESDLIAVPKRLIRNQDKFLRSGDILISSANSWDLVGKCSYVGDLPYTATAGGFISIVRPKPTKTHPRFLYHWLNSSRVQHTIRNLGRQTTNISNLDVTRFRQLEFPDLDFERQSRLASILDKADVLRRRRTYALDMGDELLRSSFFQLFGDPLANPKGFRIEKVAQHLSKERAGTQSGPFGSALKKHEYTKSGIPVWGVDNVQQNQFVGEAKLFISEAKFKQLERYAVHPGDILISRAGTVGRMCVARPKVKSIISTNLVRVVLDESSLLPEYFVALFTYASGRLGALKANNKDNAFTFLNPQTLRAIEIPIPPIKLQEKYLKIVGTVRTQLEVHSEQLNGLSDLFDSLSQRAFRGEL